MGQYKLYAAALQDLSKDFEFSYYSGERKYMLVYSPTPPNESFTEIPADKEKNLTELERRWLLGCKMTLNVRHMREESEHYFGLLEEFLNDLDKNIEKAKKEEKENE
jgi:hypothetical protein